MMPSAPHAPSDDPMIGDDSQQTQQATQSTQGGIPGGGSDAHLWGYLQPCSAKLTRIDLWKISPRISFGRAPENDIVFPGLKVSSKHCSLIWSGADRSEVLVQDLSSNGTWIAGEKVHHRSAILRDGNEIGFGTCVPQPDPYTDYRFIFRYVAAGTPREGLLAHYDMGHELGKGSFATVFRCVHRDTGEWCAVKMISRTKLQRGSAAAGAVGSFAREVAILEKLRHGNVCQMREVFFEENNINLVLEYVDGGDLLEYIIKRGGLTEHEAKHITYQICTALAYIHDIGIAHRDLKPENVLLTSDDPPIVKVADFGLAKVVDSLTMLRTMCGTPSYLAPEVVLQTDAQGYDHVVDSWSVGVIVYAMLTNNNPFMEDTSLDLRNRIATRSIDWSGLRDQAVSHDGQHFIRCLLEADPKRRMTMKEALEHPWLYSHVPYYPSLSYVKMEEDEQPATAGSPSRAGQVLAAVPEVEGMDFDDVPGLTHSVPPAARARITREGSGLVRRARVLEQAEAGEGPALPQPSDEMLYAASAAPAADGVDAADADGEAGETDADGANYTGAVARRGNNKRKGAPGVATRKKARGGAGSSPDEECLDAAIVVSPGKPTTRSAARAKAGGGAAGRVVSGAEDGESPVRTRRGRAARRM